MTALARWDAFLAQIEGRHRQVLGEGEVSAHQFILALPVDGDPAPLSNQLSAVKARLQALEQNIVDTWHGKVEDAIFAEGLGVSERDAAWAKGESVRHRLDDSTEELEPRVFAELARAQAALGATCATALATHAVSQEAAVAEWRAMRVAERRWRGARPPCPLALVIDYERTQIAYWRRYLGERSRFEPLLARDPGMEIRSRMDRWYVSHAEYEPEWVGAGRPRSSI